MTINRLLVIRGKCGTNLYTLCGRQCRDSRPVFDTEDRRTRSKRQERERTGCCDDGDGEELLWRPGLGTATGDAAGDAVLAVFAALVARIRRK